VKALFMLSFFSLFNTIIGLAFKNWIAGLKVMLWPVPELFINGEMS